MIDRLRQRIRIGRYFGRWSPGDRLPSVRAVAELEGVDRKTAAAAYRRLEREGLVRVAPRSGVYLEPDAREDGRDPLQRLYRQWLETTLESAEELGLTTDRIQRVFQGVAAVERRRIPVVDADSSHAAHLAGELSRRTGLDYEPVHPMALPVDSGPLMDPPFLVATPSGALALNAAARRIPRVTLTLDSALLGQVREAAGAGRVHVVVGSASLEGDLRHALEHEPEKIRRRVAVGRDSDVRGRRRDTAARTVFWPGAQRDDGGGTFTGSQRMVADATIRAIRAEIGRAALDQVSMSSGDATRRSTGGGSPPR